MLVLAVLLFIGTILEIRGDTLFKPCSLSPYNGESKQIVSLNFDEKGKKNKFTVNSTELQYILMKPELQDKEIAILSIAGSFRKGKSFFLNLVLQILERGEVNYENINLNQSYGFHWRGGSNYDTQGMLMWSEPFCAKTKSGKNIAILLMDTQGAFDSQQTFGDSSSIFALSFLMSSIQLYNLGEHIQENDLQNLQVFTDYGKVISEQNTDKPFQQIVFLIRDWLNQEDYDYGFIGGQKYLDKILAIKNNQDQSIKQLRNGIIHSFNKLSCFLMPHPGLKVAKGNFTKQDIDKAFMENINSFTNTLLNPEIIVTKEFERQKMTAGQLYETIEIYVKTFESNDTIKPENIHEATCHVKKEYSVEKAQELFTKSMDVICNVAYSVEEEYIKTHYDINKNKYILIYENETKYCKDYIERSPTSISRLTESFAHKFDNCINSNRAKLKSECITNSTRNINDLEKSYSTNMKAKCDGASSVSVEHLENYFNILTNNTMQSYHTLNIKNCESEYGKKFEDLKIYIQNKNNNCKKDNDLKIDEECKVLKEKDFKNSKLNYTKKITEKIKSPNLYDSHSLTEYNDELKYQILSEFKNSSAIFCNGKHVEYNAMLLNWLKTKFQIYLAKLNSECNTNSTRDLHDVENKYYSEFKAKCDELDHYINVEEIANWFSEMKNTTILKYKGLSIKYCESDYVAKLEELKTKIDDDITMCNKSNELIIDKKCGILKLIDYNNAKVHYTGKFSAKIRSSNPVDTNTLTAYNDELKNEILSEFKNSNAILCNGKHLEFNQMLLDSIKEDFECIILKSKDLKYAENLYIEKITNKISNPNLIDTKTLTDYNNEIRDKALTDFKNANSNLCNEKYLEYNYILFEWINQQFKNYENKLQNQCDFNIRDINNMKNNNLAKLNAKCDQSPFGNYAEMENFFNDLRTTTIQSYQSLFIKYCAYQYPKTFDDLPSFLEQNTIICRNKRHDIHTRLVNEANSRAYTTSCIEFGGTSCSGGFTNVGTHGCGRFFCPNCKKRDCRICNVDGERLC